MVAIITPFNFPLALSAVKIATALAAGCAVVHKPSEHTPLSALALAELIQGEDLPPGAYNVVTGSGAAAGGALVRHPEVAKIVFTGSTAVGVEIAAEAARTVKRVTMELGGKSAESHPRRRRPGGGERARPLLLHVQCRPVLRGRLAPAGRPSGRGCGAGSPTTRAAETVLGDALAPDSSMGPLINEGAAVRVGEMVERSAAAGAQVVAGGAS